MRIFLTFTLTAFFAFSSFGSVQTFYKFERSIAGTVTDKNNRFIENVKVKAINLSTKKQYKTRTNESGFFKFTDLPLRTYTIKFEGKKGFLPKTIEKIEVGLNGGVRYNISLESK